MNEIASNFIHDIIDADLSEHTHTKIHTRFPPEPNGYLHISSAKANLINFLIFVMTIPTPQRRTPNTLTLF